MPASGGSVSDAPVNKVVNGQSHYLAYITPDEGKSLKQQGGKETITNSGIPAYPPPHGTAEEASAFSGIPMGGQAGSGSDAALPPQLGGPSTIEQAEQFQDAGTQEDNLIEQFKSGVIDKSTVIKNALKLGLTNSKKLMDATGITTAFSLAMGAGGEVQKKAINWELNRRLQKEYKKPTFDYEAEAAGIEEPGIKTLEERIRRANLDPDDPEHYGQNEYTRDYPGQPPSPEEGDNARGLTNIITPYAAHAIGGTTQQPSMAANWYANLGSGNTNPGAFNLTQQYAAAKASVSQRLKSTSSIGQIAVADSAFFNFLKDNSLNKGIL